MISKLLDAWIAPEGAGEPVGCVATSFTFSPLLFEEECLSRFVRIDADPVDHRLAYILEREEKLATLSCAAALVDAQHCQGKRSLRWDLLSARVPGAVLHAKVSLLAWESRVRLIVASANLTDDGYRRNQEGFVVLDYYDGSSAPRDALLEMIAFLDDAVGFAGGTGGAIRRWRDFLQDVGQRVSRYRPGRVPANILVMPILVGPGRRSAFTQLEELWGNGGVIDRADVVSPFFDRPAEQNAPAERLWALLRQRGYTEVCYHVTADEAPDGDRVGLHAPDSLTKAMPGGRELWTGFAILDEADRPTEQGPLFRPLHVKSLWLESDRFVGCMMGSSNFTSKGYGLSRSPNLEANFFYRVPRASDRDSHSERLRCGLLWGREIKAESISSWAPKVDETETETQGRPPLPAGFVEATLKLTEVGRWALEFVLKAPLPAGWLIYAEDGSEILFDEASWRAEGQPESCVVSLDWNDDRPLSAVEVGWTGAIGRAWWPVNVEGSEVLPPPAELRDLTLDTLLRILTSARPLKDILRDLRRAGRTSTDADNDDEDGRDDALRRVDTSGYLLQRVRRVSWALQGLSVRLARPHPTSASLEWRLNGPVGARALVEAIRREAATEAERAFLVSEVALELSLLQPQTAPGCVSVNETRRMIRNFVDDVMACVDLSGIDDDPALQRYVQAAWRDAGRK